MSCINIWMTAAAVIGVGGAIGLTVGQRCRRLIKEKEAEIDRLKTEIESARTLDEITSLFNYAMFDKAAYNQIKLARRHKWPVTLLIIDVGDLEKINLRYGYNVGNAILKHVAQILQRIVRESDVLGRFGGSKIYLLMANCDQNHAVEIFGRIYKKAQEPYLLDNGKALKLNLTGGAVTMYGLHAKLTEMMELAERALELAKESGAPLKIVDQDGVEIKSFDA